MIPLILCSATALVVCLAFLRYHIRLWQYPLYYTIPLVLAVFIPLFVTILLPVDYVTHNSGFIPGFALSDHQTLLLWKASYWTTFILTWLLLPVLLEYYKAGSYSKKSKLKISLKRNLKFQAIILLVSVAGAIYLILEAGLSFSNLKSMLIALAHIYALVLSLWLMAHGLIAIPRNRWLEGNLMQNLNHHYLKIPKLVDTIEDTKISFKEEVLQVIILKENFTNPSDSGTFQYRDWILHLYDMIPGDIKENEARQYVYSESVHITRDQITDSFMTHLAYNFQSNLFKLSAHTSEYDKLLGQISALQSLIEAKSSQNDVERTQIMEAIGGYLPPKLNFYFLCYVKPILARILSIGLFAVSFIIIQSEFFHSTRLSLINVLIYKSGIHNHVLLQGIFTSLFFMYMLFCSLNSLTKLKIFNMYHLVPHDSDPVSACFYGSYIARMTVPLSYNFITLFVSRESIFEEWYGSSIHLTGLFNLMNNWIPRLLLIPIVLTTFNVYDKIKNKMGLNSDFYDWADFDDEEALNTSGDIEQANAKRKDLIIVEAKRLVAMEFNRRNNPGLQARHSYQPQPRSSSRYDDAAPVNGFSDMNLDNRIDYEEDFGAGFTGTAPQALWTRLEDTFSGIRTAVSTRLGRNHGYRDEPLDTFNYDEDANENLVL